MKIERISLIAIIALLALVLAIFSFFIPGPQGSQGVSGVPGPQGSTGIQGVIGPQGVEGLQGVGGSDGTEGETGVQGIPGEAGTPGEIIREITTTNISTLATDPTTIKRGWPIKVVGTGFFYNPEIWLYDSSGNWFKLGVGKIANNKFLVSVTIPSTASIGVAEISARNDGGKGTYTTTPIIIQY